MGGAVVLEELEGPHPPVQEGSFLSTASMARGDFDSPTGPAREYEGSGKGHGEIGKKPLGSGSRTLVMCLLGNPQSFLQFTAVEVKMSFGSPQLKVGVSTSGSGGYRKAACK